MKRALLMLAGLIFAGAALSQDLLPGALLLSRVKAHMSEEFHRLTTLSCLETVVREHQAAKGKMRPLDTIRLEVLTTGHKELFASPGDRKFSENHPMSYAGSGALGDGLFGSYLEEILLNDDIASQYKGDEDVGGLRLARYDYRIPLRISGQTIRTPEGSGRVGLHGSYWVDPRTYDVIRLKMYADDFPPNLPVSEMATTINYARTRLDNGLVVLLPEAADVRLARYSGEINHNKVEFTHCRVYGAESTINFNGPDAAGQTAQFGAAVVDDTLRTLPGGLQIAVKLSSRISGDIAVGTLIDGVVAGNVTVKRSILIPDGSPLRGRIRRMERYTDPLPYFVVGLEFTEMELHGVRYLFYADLVDFDPVPGLSQGLSTKNTTTTMANPFPSGDQSTIQTTESLSLPSLPGVATFFYKGASLDLPRDFRTVWKTHSLKP